MAKKNPRLSSLTVLEAEKQSKKNLAQEKERLEVLGGYPEEKAVEWVQKDVLEREAADREYFENMVYLLERAKGDKKNYLRILSSIFSHFLKFEAIPKKYRIEGEINDIGLVVKIVGTPYYGAFRACGETFYDFRACQVQAIKVGNTIAKLSGHIRKSDAGILLPDAEDYRIATRRFQNG